ncbi:MAG: hypothetical protein V1767_01035 [Chloroflexota bacterium]
MKKEERLLLGAVIIGIGVGGIFILTRKAKASPQEPPEIPVEVPPVIPPIEPPFEIPPVELFYLVSTTDGHGRYAPPGDKYTAGSTLTLVATPDTDSTFGNWVIDGRIFTDNPINLKMDKNRFVTVNFVRKGSALPKTDITLPGDSSLDTVIGYTNSGYTVYLTQPIIPPPGVRVITDEAGTVYGYVLRGDYPYTYFSANGNPAGKRLYLDGVYLNMEPGEDVDQGGWSGD